MSQPQQQYPPRPFSPPQPTPSPQHGLYGPPPAKRPRLSPNAQSPYNSPGMANISLPNQVFSGPFPGSRPYGSGPQGHASYNTFNPQPLHQAPSPQIQHQQQQQQQPPQTGNMGPPSKPVEKDRPTDMNELSDVLMGSGVDLKEEEAALLNRHNQDSSFHSNIGDSFHSTGSATVTHPEYKNYNVYSQNVPGGRDTFYGAGTLNQLAVPDQSKEEMAEVARKRGLRRKAEMEQYHLNNPFLLTQKVNRTISTKARNERVQVPNAGLYHPQAQKEVQQIVCGPDKHERLVTLKGEDLLNHDAPLSDMLALISCAAEERLRSLIEDAASIAKNRQTGSHGIIPTQYLDIAATTKEAAVVETTNGLPTPGNSAVSPKANPLKRMLIASALFYLQAHIEI
ncbi:MAG: hypothetical protein Q9222_007051 [Ikaeria aurantiellina]